MFVRSLFTKAHGLASFLAVLGVAAAGCGGNPQTSDAGSNGVTASSTGSGGADGGTASGGEGGSTGSGQTGPCDPSLSTCPCSFDGQCAATQQCVGGLCVTPCTVDYQCKGDTVCANNQCLTKCDGAFPCPDAGYMCLKGVCVPDLQNPECTGASDCKGAGESCVGGFCTTECTTNDQCDKGKICDWKAKVCVDDFTAKGACTASTECTSARPQVCGGDGFCRFVCDPVPAQDPPQDPPPTPDQYCQSIDSRFVKCDQNICKMQAELSFECKSKSDCDVGMDCISNKCK